MEDSKELETLKLDYSIQSPQARTALVQKIVDSLPPEKLTNRYLEAMATYIVFAMTKEEKKKKKINTDNRMVTINKRETSFQGLVSKFESGEDGIYNLIANDKNIIFTPKVSITEEDVETIPGLKQLQESIAEVEAKEKKATGKRRFILKKQLIQLRQDQYVLKNCYKQPVNCLNGIKNFYSLNFDDNITINKDGKIVDKSLISFMNPKHVSALLRNYSRIKQDCYGKFYTDGYFLMQSLDKLVDKTFEKDFPLYYSLLIYKIDGKTNVEIQSLLQQQHDVHYSVEYISSLWRNKIPKMIVETAKKDFLLWYYTNQEKGKWKKCSRCGEIKLAHNIFFSRNTSSKDGYYSICKDCRNNRKNRVVKIVKRIPYKGD